jgi:gas vesicle protein
MEERTIVVKRAGFGTFLRGALIGAGIALLLAPRSGRETRDMLSERGMEMRDKANEIVQDTRGRAQNYIYDARNKLNDTLSSLKEGVASDPGNTNKELKRDVEILEDINNPNYNV